MAAKKNRIADIKAAHARVMARRARGKKRKGRVKRAYKVVSLRAALRAVRQAERRINARGYRYRGRKKNPDLECGNMNPLRHFPTIEGRGRPAKKRTFDIVTRYADGQIKEERYKGSQREAYARARSRFYKMLYGGGPKIVEIIVDDRRRAKR